MTNKIKKKNANAALMPSNSTVSKQLVPVKYFSRIIENTFNRVE